MTNKFDEITLAAEPAATASYCPPESDVCDGDSCDYCEGMASAVLINCTGTTVYGNIAYRLQDVWYKFNTPAAGTYRMESSGNVDTVGYLYDNNGTLLYTDHDSGSGNNFRMDASLGRDETFYIRITTYGATIGTFGITVAPFVPVSSITLNKTTLNMLPNQSEHLVATVDPENATVKDVQWFSNVPEVAEVNGGWICSNEEGTATIYARAKDGSGVQASCTVTVATNKVTSITLDQTSLELNPGESKRIIATPLPENATNKNLYWFSTCPEIAVVTDGWVCAVSPGEAQIYACATDGNGIQAICSVTVLSDKVSSIKLTETTIVLQPGETYNMEVGIEPSYAANKNLSWFSTCPSVADVTDGVICAGDEGEATIYVCATDGGGAQSTCYVQVAKTKIAKISLSLKSIELIPGEDTDISAKISPSGAYNKSLYWFSDCPEVADVSENKIYAHSVGEAKIYAYANDGSGVNAFCTVKVSPYPVRNIFLSAKEVSIYKGGRTQLKARPWPDYATNKAVSWSSSNSDIAEVDAEGNVYGKLVGEATICATAADGSGVYKTCVVKVATHYADTIIVSPHTAMPMVGTSFQLDYEIYPSNASNQCVEWSSSDETVAIVDPISGYVTAVGSGEATICATASDGSGVKGYCTVKTHPPIPVDSVRIYWENSMLEMNQKYQYEAQILPGNATNQHVTWTSSDSTIVKIGEKSGIAKALKPGTVTITATSPEGVSDSVTLSVKKIKATIIPNTVDNNTTGTELIVFEDTSHVWRRVKKDLIYSEEFDELATTNAYANFFVNPGVDNTQIKEYDPEEMRLIYALDPHGLAHYVFQTSFEIFQKSGSAGTEALIEYKDGIFELLFKRKPEHYTRDWLGRWSIANESVNINSKVSESEIIFGMRKLYDLHSFLVVALEAFNAIVSSSLPAPIDMFEDVVKFFSGDLVYDGDEEFEEIIKEIGLEGINLGWYSTILDGVEFFKRWIDATSPIRDFVDRSFEYCLEKTNYSIDVKVDENTIIPLEEYWEAI